VPAPALLEIELQGARQVRRAGAVPKLVTHGETVLGDAVAALDAAEAGAAASVHGWYADLARDRVVIEVDEGRSADAESLAALAGVDAFTVQESAERPRTYTDIVGGNPYYFQDGGSWYVCSIGFGAEGGYVTAGHCGDEGSDTWYDPRPPSRSVRSPDPSSPAATWGGSVSPTPASPPLRWSTTTTAVR
jgi:streptogrisin C